MLNEVLPEASGLYYKKTSITIITDLRQIVASRL
jgi:hypothetical protein